MYKLIYDLLSNIFNIKLLKKNVNGKIKVFLRILFLNIKLRFDSCCDEIVNKIYFNIIIIVLQQLLD